jgi:hypothetical protein
MGYNMKKLAILALVIATFAIVACSSLSNASNSTTAGTSCGKTLANLYTGYKSTGKIDMTNSNTLLQVIELGTYTEALVANKNNEAYKKSFAQGLVLGSSGLILDNNSMSTVNSLISLTGLTQVKKSSTVDSKTASNISTNLGGLLKNLKK